MSVERLHETQVKESVRELRQIALKSYSQILKVREEGIKLGESRIIKAMYRRGIDISSIVEIVNMPVDEIKRIINND